MNDLSATTWPEIARLARESHKPKTEQGGQLE